MILEIPVALADPLFDMRISLEGSDYLFRFDYNDRESRWYLSIADIDGAWLATGVKLVSNVPLLAKRVGRGLPPGELIVIDASGESPDFSALGRSATIVYATSDELAGRAFTYTESADMSIFPDSGEPGGPVEMDGNVVGKSNESRVVAIQNVPVQAGAPADDDVLTGGGGSAKWKAPKVPTAAQITFSPGSTGLPNDVQGAIVETFNKPPSSDATKIRGVDVSATAPTVGQSLVANSSTPGAYVPRFTGTSRVVVIDTSGPHSAQPGDILIVQASVVGDVDIRLPVSPVIGAPVQVKRMSANAALVTVDGMGGKIDGDSAISIKPHEAATLRYYAAGEWARMGKCEAVAEGSVRHLGLEYDPIALWKLDGSLTDYSGNGFTAGAIAGANGGFVTSAPHFRCAYVQQTGFASFNAARFLPLASLLDATAQALILPAVSSATQSTIFRLGTANPTHLHMRVSNASTILTWTNSTNTGEVTVTAPAPEVGKWSLIGATRRIVDGKVIARVYINGARVAEAADLALPYTLTAGTPSVVIGGSNSAGYGAYYGLIGSVKLTDFALSDAEMYAEAQKAGLAP